MNKLIFISALTILAGCQSTSHQGGSSLASDDFDRSSCANCKLEPFYVDGHWVEERN